MFIRPTLVTLTAPTCSGKSYLLEHLVKNGFQRIVSTTDRIPRKGEFPGVDYFFISTEESKRMEAADEFAELVTYNGTRYGVTHVEMQDKISAEKPPIVILEPSGLRMYQEYCAKQGYDIFSIFVNTDENIRLERLCERTIADVKNSPANFEHIIRANNKRLVAILKQEKDWDTRAVWDSIVPGTNVDEALQTIIHDIGRFYGIE